MTKPVILAFVATYVPGYQSGGPVRTIANFVDHLGEEFDIRIVCRDRDALDSVPYPSVVVDSWNTSGKAQVFYASEKTLGLCGISRLLRNTPHDVLYLNSFFNHDFVALPLLARRLGMAPRTPCVIAPRGEFSQGAIGLKGTKKRAYLSLVKRLGLYRDLHWQASSVFELADIRREFGDAAEKISVAPNLPPAVSAAANQVADRAPGPPRLVFLSRISPMKNLDYLLRVLGDVKSPVDLSIYGPLREPDYWRQCLSLIDGLPSNVRVEYRGIVEPERVLTTLSHFDLFILPTRGENYGHVILEALLAGTPVLISDETPWRESGDGAITMLSLDKPEKWVLAINDLSNLSDEGLQSRKYTARQYAQSYLENSAAVDQNRQCFRLALRESGEIAWQE